MQSSFAPSRTKFLRMPSARQHKWLAQLLADGYKHLDQTSIAGLERIYWDYIQCLKWIDSPYPEMPRPEKPLWKEWFSHQFHHHQQATHIGLGTEGFLEQPIEGDQLSGQPGKANLTTGLRSKASAAPLTSAPFFVPPMHSDSKGSF